MINRSTYGLLFIIITVILSGCTQKPVEQDYTDQSIVIFTSVPNEQSFYQSYGNLILQHFPGVDIQLHINDTENEVNAELMNSIQPDLLFLFHNDFVRLQEEGFLLPLELNEKKVGLDPSQYAELILQMLSDQTGTLYGLAPNAYMSALIYNKQFFSENDIDVLNDGMSWDEVFTTVKLLSNNLTEYNAFEMAGLTPASLLLDQLAPTNQLALINEEGEVVIGGAQWEQAIDDVASLFQQSKLAKSYGDLFLKGESAILYNNIYTFNELNESGLNWGFVSIPTNPINRNHNYSVIIDQAIALPMTTSTKDLSYQIIKVLMSEEASTIYSSGLKLHTISTLQSKMNTYAGVDISNLWTQSTYPQRHFVLPKTLEQSSIDQIYQSVNKHLQLVIDKQMTTEECIASLQEQLSLIVDMRG